jgi:DNA-binding CsgD family transcriptional regulator
MLRRAHRAAMSCGSLRVVDMVARAMPSRPSIPSTASTARRASTPPRAGQRGGPARPAAAGVLAGRMAVATPRSARPPFGPAPGAVENRLSPLTARERQIAWIAGSGTKTGTIARQLGVSPRTVDVHLSRIYRKLGIPGRAGLVAIVARMDPGTPPPGSPPPVGHGEAAWVAHGRAEDLGQQVGQPPMQPASSRST